MVSGKFLGSLNYPFPSLTILALSTSISLYTYIIYLEECIICKEHLVINILCIYSTVSTPLIKSLMYLNNN
ncbi:hypothetical protein CLU79DRAFT_754922, partial [Phycomyces nitens]